MHPNSMYTKELKAEIDTIISADNNANLFFNDLKQIGDIIFFGGSVRDYRLNPSIYRPRDFDIILNGSNFDKSILIDLIEFHNVKYKKNKFKGFKLSFKNIDIDIWEMSETWAFKERLIDAHEANIVDSVYLSIDSIAYNYSSDRLYSERFESTIENKVIDIVLEENPYEELNLMRALVAFDSIEDLELSDNIKKRFLSHYGEKGSEFIRDLYTIQMRRYKKEILNIQSMENKVKEFSIK